MLEFLRRVLGMPQRLSPLKGLPLETLRAFVTRVPAEFRPVVDAQHQRLRLYRIDGGREVYLYEEDPRRGGRKTAPTWPGTPEELKLGQVWLKVRGRPVTATIWLTMGRLGVIEYDADVGQFLNDVPEVLDVRFEPSAQSGVTSVASSGKPPRVPPWVLEILGVSTALDVHPPMSETTVAQARGTWPIPPDLEELWRHTDGLSFQGIEIAGPTTVRELELSGERYLVLGTLEVDPIVLPLTGDQHLYLLDHTTRAKVPLGPSMREALRSLKDRL